mgnify:CR=1 FL=1
MNDNLYIDFHPNRILRRLSPEPHLPRLLPPCHRYPHDPRLFFPPRVPKHSSSDSQDNTLYRYATVNVRELAENLNPEELKMAVKGFAEAFIRSMPTGKQNTFANRTLPDMVYVTLREDQPINLAGGKN